MKWGNRAEGVSRAFVNHRAGKRRLRGAQHADDEEVFPPEQSLSSRDRWRAKGFTAATEAILHLTKRLAVAVANFAVAEVADGHAGLMLLLLPLLLLLSRDQLRGLLFVQLLLCAPQTISQSAHVRAALTGLQSHPQRPEEPVNL